MQIIRDYPPNIEKIRKVFGDLPERTVFAYGPILFNPSGLSITNPLHIHELTHTAQQGKDIDAWWDRYLDDKQFRFNQELEAFSNEYNAYRTMYRDRNQRERFLYSVASRLSSPMYGNLIMTSEAKKLIKEHADSGYTEKR